MRFAEQVRQEYASVRKPSHRKATKGAQRMTSFTESGLRRSTGGGAEPGVSSTVSSFPFRVKERKIMLGDKRGDAEER